MAAARTDLTEEARDTCAQLSHAGDTATVIETPEAPAAAEVPEEVAVVAAALPSPKPRRRAPAKPK